MAVIIAGVLVFGMSVSLYAIIAVYVTALVTDTVLEGTKQARAVWIISDKNEQIAPVVMEKMHRGITRFPASGVYTQCAAVRGFNQTDTVSERNRNGNRRKQLFNRW